MSIQDQAKFLANIIDIRLIEQIRQGNGMPTYHEELAKKLPESLMQAIYRLNQTNNLETLRNYRTLLLIEIFKYAAPRPFPAPTPPAVDEQDKDWLARQNAIDSSGSGC